MSTNTKVKVLNPESKEILFECEIAEIASAFSYAAQMEQMGIAVTIQSPTITETLCSTLGLSLDEKEDYQQSILAEIEDHDGSCCATPAKLLNNKSPVPQ